MYYVLIGFVLVISTLNILLGNSYGRNVAKNKRIELYCFVFCVLYLSCLAAFRYETGRDWQEYIRIFSLSTEVNNGLGYESGFIVLNKLFKLVFDDFYLMQVCIIFFSSFFIYRNFYRYSLLPILTLLLYVSRYYFQTDMAQTRQHIAMGILAYGMMFVHRKQFLKWVMVVILASLFHITAITAFPLYFTTRVVLRKKICWILLLIYIIIFIFGLTFVRGLLNVAVQIPFIPLRIKTIGLNYLSSPVFGQQSQFNSGLGFLANTCFIFYIVFIYSRKGCKKKAFYMANFFVGLFFVAMGRNLDQFARIANYYMICGCGLCGYNLIIGNKQLFRNCEFIRITFFLLFIFFELYNFFSMWFSYSPLIHSSYHLDYTPWKSFLFNR